MEPCSKKVFAAIYSEDERGKLDVDTNIISITFNDIPEKQLSLTNSLPISCSFCKAILSNLSLLFEIDEYKAFISQKEEKKFSELAIFEKIEENSKIWLCDFCGIPNNLPKKLLLNLPNSSDVFYGKSVKNTEEKPDIPFKSAFEKDQSIIFCIDNSGSMSGTNLNCVNAAVLSQLKEIHAKNPKKKVGLITFESGVIVYGDAFHKEISISSDIFEDFESLLNKGIEFSDKFLNKSLDNSMEKLSKKIGEIETGGSTALGPGLLVSMGLLHKGKTGSMIVLCTDGMANCGVGSMGNKKCDEFYEKAGKYAKDKGILISVLTIKGGECKVDKLAILSDLTGGMVSRIKPTKIGKDFKKAFVGEMIGIDARIRVQLHRALAFKNEEIDKIQIEKEISMKNSIFVKNLGNVTLSTEETFEFRFKNKGELSAIGLNIDKLKEIPIQAQIQYTSIEGVEILRVLTIKLEVSRIEEEVKKIANVKIVAMRWAHDVAKEADSKNFITAKKKFEKWRRFLEEDLSVKNQENESFQKYYGIVKKKNEDFGKELNKNIARKMRGKEEKIMKEVENLEEEEKLELKKCCEMNSSEGSSDECQTRIRKFAKKRQASFNCLSDNDSDGEESQKKVKSKKNVIGSSSDSDESVKIKLNWKADSDSDSDNKGKMLKRKLSTEKNEELNSDSDSESEESQKKARKITNKLKKKVLVSSSDSSDENVPYKRKTSECE